jgi:hypothetical protein
VTILQPEKRLAQHNSQHGKHAGRIVKETGQKWELKTCIEVADPYWSERAFWATLPLSISRSHRCPRASASCRAVCTGSPMAVAETPGGTMICLRPRTRRIRIGMD